MIVCLPTVVACYKPTDAGQIMGRSGYNVTGPIKEWNQREADKDSEPREQSRDKCSVGSVGSVGSAQITTEQQIMTEHKGIVRRSDKYIKDSYFYQH